MSRPNRTLSGRHQWLLSQTLYCDRIFRPLQITDINPTGIYFLIFILIVFFFRTPCKPCRAMRQCRHIPCRCIERGVFPWNEIKYPVSLYNLTIFDRTFLVTAVVTSFEVSYKSTREVATLIVISNLFQQHAVLYPALRQCSGLPLPSRVQPTQVFAFSVYDNAYGRPYSSYRRERAFLCQCSQFAYLFPHLFYAAKIIIFFVPSCFYCSINSCISLRCNSICPKYPSITWRRVTAIPSKFCHEFSSLVWSTDFITWIMCRL